MSKSPVDRLPVQKTYKLYINGQFPRSESGRYYQPPIDGVAINVCLASRKDFRDAVAAARGALPGWCGKSAFNRGQILYRIAEMMEGRRDQFATELVRTGIDARSADAETRQAIDRLIHYAGWCDKFQQIFSSVNPVASSHFNFSLLEPTGIVAIIASETSPLLGLVSLIAPVIAGGNTCVVLASRERPLPAITFAEVVHSSDVPGGVINILTGDAGELAGHFASHMDVNAVAVDRDDADLVATVRDLSAGNVKRVRHYDCDWTSDDNENPYLINDFCEVKTTWHPIEQITATGSGY